MEAVVCRTEGETEIGRFLVFVKGKLVTFSISTDGEIFQDTFETREEAFVAAIKLANEDGRTRMWIGNCRPPIQPEHLWHTFDWIEQVDSHEDYCGEWAENWHRSVKSQRDELEVEVSKLLAAWLDKHKLRPKFFCVEDSERIVLGSDHH